MKYVVAHKIGDGPLRHLKTTQWIFMQLYVDLPMTKCFKEISVQRSS
jgi:hypothetical protein